MESKAAESYRAFESLRNRFGEAKSPRKYNVLPSRLTPKSRTDPRSNAPPLVPLIEEGDQVQAAFFHERRDAQLVSLQLPVICICKRTGNYLYKANQ